MTDKTDNADSEPTEYGLHPGFPPAWSGPTTDATPMPDRGIGAASLLAFWKEKWTWYRSRRHLFESPHEHVNCAECYQRRHAAKCDMRSAEWWLQLLHRAVAPEATRVCEEDCGHIAAGMTAEQARTVLLRLHAEIESLNEYLFSDASYGGNDWAYDELDIHRDEMRAFVRLIGSAELAAHFNVTLRVESIEPTESTVPNESDSTTK
jgi:hypothetical protein